MRVKIQKWGNSLAVRIPKAMVSGKNLSDGSVVEMRLTGGGLLLKPVRPTGYRLEDLLAGVTKDNRHGEVDMGPPVGREVW
jgi:antitoxin MazE